MQKEVAVVACANIQSILSSKEREAYMMNTGNWTTVLSHNLRNVHNTRWKTNLMRRRPYQFTESLQNTFYNLICCALLLLFASNVHSLYSRLVHPFSEQCACAPACLCVCVHWEHLKKWAWGGEIVNAMRAHGKFSATNANIKWPQCNAFHGYGQCKVKDISHSCFS